MLQLYYCGFQGFMAVNPPSTRAQPKGKVVYTNHAVCTFCTIYIGWVDLVIISNYVILIVHYIRIYDSKPPRTRAKPRGQGWFTFAINYNVVDNKCYIYRSTRLNEKYLLPISYLTLDVTIANSLINYKKFVRIA